MSREAQALEYAAAYIGQVLKDTVTGTADMPRQVKLLDLALEHAEAWAADQPPKRGAVGGSSTPEDEADGQEAARVKRMAAEAAVRIPQITREVEKLMLELYRTVPRLTGTVHPEKRPAALPGCKSCARVDGEGAEKVGGHFAAVYDKAKKHGLCRWCLDVRTATGLLPPIQATDIYHRQGPRAAGLWMAKREQRKAS